MIDTNQFLAIPNDVSLHDQFFFQFALKQIAAYLGISAVI
jgi:hypothetical protein